MGKPTVNYTISNLDGLDTITPKQKMVLEMRLGIGKYTRQHTLKEISDLLGYKGSGERARQIEAVALRKLRHPSRNCKVNFNYG